MFSSKKLMLVFGILIITSMVLAACGGQPVVETVVVTEVVEVAGTPQVVEKVITATPAPEVEAPPAMGIKTYPAAIVTGAAGPRAFILVGRIEYVVARTNPIITKKD